MNSENFHEYLKNPTMLYQVSYQELKSLVLQYPYSPNLRYLLLLKSLFDQNKDYERNLTLASLNSPDRKRLRQIVKQYTRLREIQENYALSEDFLELKDLSSLESIIDAFQEKENVAPTKGISLQEKIPAKGDVPEPAGGEALPFGEEGDGLGFLEEMTELHADNEESGKAPEPEEQDERNEDLAAAVATEVGTPTLEDLLDIEMEEATQGPEATATPPVAGEENLPDDGADEPAEPAEAGQMTEEIAPAPQPSKAIPLEITNETDGQPAPLPKSQFNSWLRRFKPPQAGMLAGELKDISLNSRYLHEEAEQVKDDAKHVADKSVAEDDDIISETLALLLEKQKHYEKAISMYRRLGLQYPEKSSLFAAKIEELSKKL
ncbi:MAG: hypothetical protein HY842_09280 [Bacteroidetes bacterium]|nr:hypothetical protein [Bacteroidota bacterium]